MKHCTYRHAMMIKVQEYDRPDVSAYLLNLLDRHFNRNRQSILVQIEFEWRL